MISPFWHDQTWQSNFGGHPLVTSAVQDQHHSQVHPQASWTNKPSHGPSPGIHYHGCIPFWHMPSCQKQYQDSSLPLLVTTERRYHVASVGWAKEMKLICHILQSISAEDLLWSMSIVNKKCVEEFLTCGQGNGGGFGRWSSGHFVSDQSGDCFKGLLALAINN